MSKRLKAGIIKYSICLLICGGIAWFYADVRNFSTQPLVEQYRILCDACTLPGLSAIMIGFLLAIANDGFFLGLSYCVGVAWKALIPGGRLKIQRYGDYVAERKGKKVTGYSFLFVVGGIFMAAAVVFMILFYRIY